MSSKRGWNDGYVKYGFTKVVEKGKVKAQGAWNVVLFFAMQA